MTSDTWPNRPLLFALLGGILAFAIYHLTDSIGQDAAEVTWRASLSAAIASFGLVFAIVVRRDRLFSGVVFSLLVAVVVGGIGYWRLHIDWPHIFNFAALAVALFVLSPFYQTSLHSKWHSYLALHHHSWSNAVILPLGLLFVGLTFGMAYMIAELFSLVGINVLKKLLRQDITGWMLGGASLGASLGVLREHEGIIASTQRLVQSIFSLLAAPVALGLCGFLLVLPFTGLESLWNNTRNTSATLFACALAALVFLNSVVREDSSNQSQNRLMQWAARLLAVCLAPLALIAALAIRLRVDQYGWTPDRFWATVICALLVVYGAFYIVAALRKLQFNETIRKANIALAILVCAVALLLATPILDFGAYSVKDQLTRLKNGRIAEGKLDLSAMAFDFGPAGREALQDLRRNGSKEFAARIDEVLNAKSRWAANKVTDEIVISVVIRVLNGSAEIPASLLAVLGNNQVCRNDYCFLLWTENKAGAFLVDQNCRGSAGCRPEVQLYRRNADRWDREFKYSSPDDLLSLVQRSDEADSAKALIRRLDAAAQAGTIEIRPVQRMQVFIDGHAIGPSSN